MSSINGMGICMGTSYIGRSEVENDGSYVTTQWLSILFPLVPLASARVWPHSYRRTMWIPFFYTSTQFEAKRVPFYWPHMFEVYGIYLAIFLVIRFASLIGGHVPSQYVLHPLLATFLAFALSVFVIEISKGIRKIHITFNVFFVLMATLASYLAVAEISADPMSSATKLIYLWVAYLILNFLFRKENSKENDDKKQIISRKKPEQVRKSTVPDSIDYK